MRNLKAIGVLIAVLIPAVLPAQTHVVSTTPVQNSEGVAVGGSIQVSFNNDIDLTSITSNTVKLLGSVAGTYLFSTSYDPTSKTLIVTPAVSFRYGEVIHLSLTSQIKDVFAGSITPYVLSFKTKYICGTGTFTQTAVAPVGNTPEGIGAIDLDGDQDLDFIVANYYSNSVTIFENTGFGTITQRAVVAIGYRPQAVPMAVGDFDGDGDNDFAVPCRGSGYVSVFTNNGGWSFSVNNISIGGAPLGSIAGDIDADGDLDLVFGNLSNIQVYLNNGSGTFIHSATLSPGGQPHSPTLADIDGDGDLDLMISRYSAGSIITYLNNGAGTFIQLSINTVGSHPRTIEPADYDLDGDIDLAVANSQSAFITLLWNNGVGAFTSSTVPASPIPHTTSAFDIEGDGDPDLLISNGLILENDGSGGFTAVNTGSTHEYPVVGDIDGDGDADIARVSNTAHAIRLLLNGGTPLPESENGVLVLDGSGDYVDLPESQSMTTFTDKITMEAFINIDTYPTSNDCSVLNTGNQTDYSLNVTNTGRLFVRLYRLNPTATLDLYSNTVLSKSTWYHVAYVYDGSTARFYINGELDAVSQQSGNLGNSPQSEHIAIGANYYNGSYVSFFDGKVDELRIWSDARSQTEIRSAMCDDLGVNDRNNLVGYWQFEAGGTDSSPNSNHGLLQGDAHIIAEVVTVCASPVADAGADASYECSSLQGTNILLDGSGSSDPNSTTLSYTWYENNAPISSTTSTPTALVSLSVGIHSITLVVENEYDLTASDDVTITITDNTAPVISELAEIVAPTDAGVCYRSAQNLTLPTPSVLDVCSSNISLTNDAPASYPRGTTVVTWTAEDEYGNTSTQSQLVTIYDDEDPQIAVSVSPSVLWPPNHQMVEVSANIIVTDNCSAQYTLKSITSNEPDNGLGDGDTVNDIQFASIGTMDDVFSLRAERSGMGNGRIYTVVYEAEDGDQNVSTATANVYVPHSAPKTVAEGKASAEGFSILQSYPSPFSVRTSIQYQIPSEGLVSLKVYNVLGEEVGQLTSQYQATGTHTVGFERNDLPAGIYLCRLEWNSEIRTIRLVIDR